MLSRKSVLESITKMQPTNISNDHFKTLIFDALGLKTCSCLEDLRSVIPRLLRDKALAAPAQYQPPFMVKNNPNYDDNRLHDLDMDKVTDILWDLIIEGVLRPGNRGSNKEGLFFFHLTERGQDIIDNGTASPNDPGGFLKSLIQDIPELDEVIIRYLKESLEAHRASLPLAATVTLGAASEKAMLMLFEAVVAYMPEAQRTAFTEPLKKKMIKQKFDAISAKLRGDIGASLPEEIKDRLQLDLDTLFEFIRVQRNEAGHPSGKVSKLGQVHADLTTFPHFLRKVYSVIGWLRANTTSPPLNSSA